MLSNSSVLHKNQVNSVIKDCASNMGLDPSNYSTHSLGAGSVSDASSFLPEHLLKSMGDGEVINTSLTFVIPLTNMLPLPQPWQAQLTNIYNLDYSSYCVC